MEIRETTVRVDVESNLEDLLKKAEKFNMLMKEANSLANELASMELELEIKV